MRKFNHDFFKSRPLCDDGGCIDCSRYNHDVDDDDRKKLIDSRFAERKRNNTWCRCELPRSPTLGSVNLNCNIDLMKADCGVVALQLL